MLRQMISVFLTEFLTDCGMVSCGDQGFKLVILYEIGGDE